MSDSMFSNQKMQFGLNGNTLKIIAAITMLIDHTGFLLFPQSVVLRVIGRLAYPIYAFMIAEGCRHTRNKLRYFIGIFVLAVLCQTVYFFVVRDLELSILVTFSLSILLIYAWQFCRKCFEENDVFRGILSLALLVSLIVGVYGLNQWIYVDYGFWGSVTPLLASIFMRRDQKSSGFDRNVIHVTMLGLGLLMLSWEYGAIQSYSFLALPLLYLYNGHRGKVKMKYFFYIFYPVHLTVLQGIYMLFQLF